ncbi:MAG: ribonuclease R [Candidatus Pacebacteria bacterium]|nr:ribonuclease R [Candidatus Paceibacterota bacterium]
MNNKIKHAHPQHTTKKSDVVKKFPTKRSIKTVQQNQKSIFRGTKNNMQSKKIIGGSQTVEGRLIMSGKGLGYLETYEGQPRRGQLEIDPTFLRTALDRDRVRVLRHPHVKGRDYETGEVVEVLERARKGHGGVLVERGGVMLLHPSDRKMYVNIIIPQDKLNGAKVGDKIFVEIEQWDNSHETPLGRVTHILGVGGENDAEMKAIALEKGFFHSLPDQVESEAREMERLFDVSKEIKKRRDMRSATTFTIDPADAKDFDDALSFSDLGDGLYEVGIHIADVSFFVREGGVIDQEAYDRATSVYLVDRTIPMLPEILSNNLCSLVPDQDRLTMSAIFTLDAHGTISKEWYGETIIHSKKRFSYEDAQKTLDTGTGPLIHEITVLNNIAKELRSARARAGALMIDAPEVKFTLDGKGRPIGVSLKHHGDTNHLIEEFMLLANRKVSEWVEKKFKKNERVFVYRVHDKPDPDKMENLSYFLSSVGFSIKKGGGIIASQTLNSIIKKSQGTPLDGTLEMMVTRTMAKAIYTTKNIGHYGLAFSAYTHFTSPIRRYPDLMVHRLIKRYTAGKRPDIEHITDLEKKCIHSSRREREAQEAERQSIKYKQVEYMAERIGKIFDGVVTGVSEWGIYVAETVSRSEGLIRMRDIGDDYFELDEKRMRIIGKRSKKIYTLGTKVRIKVVSTDIRKRTIDYVFIESK